MVPPKNWGQIKIISLEVTSQVCGHEAKALDPVNHLAQQFAPAHDPETAVAEKALGPVMIHFLLRRAHDLERNGLVELEQRAAIESGERLALQLEGHGHDRPRRPAVDLVASLSISRQFGDPGILENLRIEPRRLLGLV